MLACLYIEIFAILQEFLWFNPNCHKLILQAGDGYLAGLAARYAAELHFDEDDVLHQLEDLRSAATSDWPCIRSVNPSASNNTRRMSAETESHNYANYPGNLEDKSFLPGIYAVSILCSDESSNLKVRFS